VLVVVVTPPLPEATEPTTPPQWTPATTVVNAAAKVTAGPRTLAMARTTRRK
jgi:hypothetical protein